MVGKEVADIRWKTAVCAILALAAIVTLVFSYEFVKDNQATQQFTQLPGALRWRMESFDVFFWSQWFIRDALLILGLLGAILGVGAIAGEASKGTIFLLLSRPVSRNRILLTKYFTSAVALLIVSLVSSLGLIILAEASGHPQNMAGVLVSTLLLWLGLLFVLGLALLFSIFFSDNLRPLMLVLVVWIGLGVPGLIPSLSDWSLPQYWASLPAYVGQEFPLKELVVSVVTAAIPLLLALWLFQKRAY